MDLKDLLRRGMIEKVAPDKELAKQLLASSENDLTAAADNLKTGHMDWALAIGYNAMLSAGMALMASKGYRAFSESHHLTVVQFCASVISKEASALVSAFNRYRIRRHDIVYGEAGSVSENEAKRAITVARELVTKIKEMVK